MIIRLRCYSHPRLNSCMKACSVFCNSTFRPIECVDNKLPGKIATCIMTNLIMNMGITPSATLSKILLQFCVIIDHKLKAKIYNCVPGLPAAFMQFLN